MNGYPLVTPHYKPLELVGQGAWGKVWRVEDTRTGRHFAVKAFAPTGDADAQAAYRQIGSIDELVAKDCGGFGLSDHTNIVGRVPQKDENNVPFVLMDYWGPSLEEELKKGAYAPRKALDIIEQVAVGAEKVHEQGKGHGDIAPKNILTKGERVGLTDFGTTTYEAPHGAGPRDGMGTETYRAPEQAKEGARPNPCSDVYALGGTLYTLLTGKAPLEFNEEDVPRHFRTFLRKSLAEDPSLRHQNVREFLDGIHTIQRGYVRRTLKSRFKRWGSLAAALAITSGLGAGGMWSLEKYHKLQDDVEFSEQARVFRLKDGSAGFDDFSDLQTLGALEFKFGDLNLAKAAFIDMEETRRAYDVVRRSGVEEPTWEQVKEHIDVDVVVKISILSGNNGYADRWMHDIAYEKASERLEEWERIGREQEAERKRVLQEEKDREQYLNSGAAPNPSLK